VKSENTARNVVLLRLNRQTGLAHGIVILAGKIYGAAKIAVLDTKLAPTAAYFLKTKVCEI
jgi:hypothetical protein